MTYLSIHVIKQVMEKCRTACDNSSEPFIIN